MAAIIIFIVIIVILFVLRKKAFVKDNGPILYFVLTTVATLIGVVLAVSLSEKQALIKEKENVIKVLKSNISTLNTHQFYANQRISIYKKINKTDSLVKVKGEMKTKLIYPYAENKIVLLNTMLSDNNFKKNLSSTGLEAFSYQQLYYESYFNSKNSIFGPIIKIIFIKHIKELLNFEIQFQNGSINEDELKKKIADTNKEYIQKLGESAQDDADLIPKNLNPYN